MRCAADSQAVVKDTVHPVRVPGRWQAVLMLSGHDDDDSHNWGRMRVLTSYKLVKHLTELKPAAVPKKVFKEVGARALGAWACVCVCACVRGWARRLAGPAG